MLKIGVLGVGHLGRIHLKCIELVDELELVGFFDPNEKNASAALKNHKIQRFDSLEDLIAAVDMVDVVTPTTTHFKLAKKAIEAGKHVFIEKPVTNTISEAEELLSLAKEMNVKVQVGHVERFNPAFLSLKDTDLKPMFIEAHRLAMFNPRGTDVSVVLDLMIHDLDIILKIVDAEVTSIHASGISIVSSTPDISNVRLEFANGCVANITASRMSLKNMRKLRLFQKDAYMSIDFLEKKSEIIRLYEKDSPNLPKEANFIELDTFEGSKLLHIDMPDIASVNAIKMELETFANAIINNETPYVTLEDGYNALKLAHQIIEDIQKRRDSLLPVA